MPIFRSLVQLDLEKSRRKWDLNPGCSAPKADALITRPTRRSKAKGGGARAEVRSQTCLLSQCVGGPWFNFSWVIPVAIEMEFLWPTLPNASCFGISAVELVCPASLYLGLFVCVCVCVLFELCCMRLIAHRGCVLHMICLHLCPVQTLEFCLLMPFLLICISMCVCMCE